MKGEGPSYRERHKVRVQCRKCGEEMAEGSLAGYRMTQHGRAVEVRWRWKTLARGGRDADVPHGLPGQGRPAKLPGRGMPRTSGDEDINAGTF